MGKNKKEVPGKVEFFRVTPGRSGGVNEFREALSEIHTAFEQKEWDKIPNLPINNETFYIDAMQKRIIDDKYLGENMYYWLVTLSKVNFDQEVVLSDVKKKINERRRKIDHGDSEGIVVDSRFIFDPFRNILAVYSKRGTVNRYELRKFICELVNIKGIQFEIILDENGYDRIDKLNIVDRVVYKVASQDNFKGYKDESRSEFGDLKFAKDADGNELKVEIRSGQLKKKKLVEKAREIFASDDIEVKSFNFEGFSDGKHETIDLVKNKLHYWGKMVVEENVDDKAAYGLLNESYDCNYKYFKKSYAIVRTENKGE